MAFRWINKQGVETESGVVIQFTGRHSLEYRSRRGKIKIHIEDGGTDTKPLIIVHERSIDRWSGGIFGMKVTDAERRAVIEVLREALAFQGLGLTLV
jgi:hypothetical protein